MRRRGFSLIELLVAIGIVGVLLGLLLAGVQKVRAAGDRARCANNVRQLGLARHNHHGTHGRLTPGVTGDGHPDEPYPYMSWMTRVLPSLEQGAAWGRAVEAFRRAPDFRVDPPHVDVRRVMPMFSCPADPRVSRPALFGDQGQYAYGLTSYLGSVGVNTLRNDGLLHLDSRHRLADVADGTSNTLLVGERPPNSTLRLGWWYAGTGLERDGLADGVLGVRSRCRVPQKCGDCSEDLYPFAAARFDDFCAFIHFWSPHPGGAHFLFADGSVRFLRYSADRVLPALATRAGGEPAPNPD